jgi:hypothetical protein
MLGWSEWSGWRDLLRRRCERPVAQPDDSGTDEVQTADQARRSRTAAAAQWRWTGVSVDPRPAEDREPSAVVIHARRAGDPLTSPPPAA